MKSRWTAVLIASIGAISTALSAQTPPPSAASAAASAAAPAPRRAPDRSFPAPHTVPGQPVDSRAPELATDKPAFPGQTRAPYEPTVPFDVVTITDQLRAPWSLAFLPEGKMLVTEKPGTLRIVDAAGAISAPLKNVPAVYYGGQVGLLDVALDRNFASNKRIFFSYSESVSEEDSNIAVASATLDQAGGALNDVKVIFRALPAVSKRTNAANQGGRIAVDRTGNLFVTIGDRSRGDPWDRAQKLDTHLGKLIRITPEGKPARGNPYLRTPGALPEIYSIGQRSQQGLAFDPQGRLWETEHGARGGDELNTPEAGKNYGWPVITHGIDYSGQLINGGLTEQAGMVQPHYYWDPVIAPSGLAFYTGNLFPQWKNSVFIGALRGTMLVRLTLDGDKIVGEEPFLFDMKSRLRDVRIGPEGAVYALTDDGKLLKLLPK